MSIALDTATKPDYAVVGLSPCLCGCGRMVRNVKNRNGRIKEFFSDKCRTRVNVQAQRLGREMLRAAMTPEILRRAMVRLTMVPVRRARQEYVDLDNMTPRERLRALCEAGVILEGKNARRKE